MKFSQLFFQNSFFERDNSKLELIDLMRKAGFVHQDGAGIYSWLSLGMLLRKKVEKVIHEEMINAGFSEIELSIIQDADLWKKTNRINTYGAELIQFKNRKQHDFVLGATCEELITNIVKNHYQGMDINLHVYQIGNKYRDELRAKAGLIRAKEFIMKDAYSFCSTEEQLEKTYQQVRKAYCNIFDRLNLKYFIYYSDNGEIGGKSSEEFHCLSEFGEDEYNNEKSLEIAHIFNLGTTYSEQFDLKNNFQEYVSMGCYGIGVSRLVMALLEQYRDDIGFVGNKNFNTFDIVISVIDYKNEILKEKALYFYDFLKSRGFQVLLDDRNIQAGKKMADAELIACQYRIVIGKNSITNNIYELLNRNTNTKEQLSEDNLLSFSY